MFLEEADVIKLTGFRQKSRQIAQLRKAGIPFTVNASGHPVVSWATVEGRKDAATEPKTAWRPKWAGNQAPT